MHVLIFLSSWKLYHVECSFQRTSHWALANMLAPHLSFGICRHRGWCHFDGLMQERRNSIANAMELRLSCTNPSIYLLIIVSLLCLDSISMVGDHSFNLRVPVYNQEGQVEPYITPSVWSIIYIYVCVCVCVLCVCVLCVWEAAKVLNR